MRLRIRLIAFAEEVRGSYWLVPGLIALAGIVAGVGLVLLDVRIGDDWVERSSWLTGNRSAGARAVLSVIASSTITVAGVVFSITLAAVTYASGQYGPRLLTNFQRDRGNQVTLGVFIGTFLYCLLVLRTIHSDEAVGAAGEGFVPHAAIYGALLLALLSIIMLIYFVHHVTDSIHINNVIARIGQALIRDIGELPERAEDRQRIPAPPLDRPVVILATETGYIQAIDRDALVRIARAHDAVLRIVRRPGDFIHRGWPLLEATAARANGRALNEDAVAAFAIGRRRTPLQNLRFAIDELVEIAARALSPGVNDPFTAIACIDWLGAAMAEFDRHGERPAVRCDGDGAVRLLSDPLGFDDYLHAAFGQLRSYAARDPNARARLTGMLEEIAASVASEDHRAALNAERARLSALPPPG